MEKAVLAAVERQTIERLEREAAEKRERNRLAEAQRQKEREEREAAQNAILMAEKRREMEGLFIWSIHRLRPTALNLYGAVH